MGTIRRTALSCPGKRGILRPPLGSQQSTSTRIGEGGRKPLKEPETAQRKRPFRRRQLPL